MQEGINPPSFSFSSRLKGSWPGIILLIITLVFALGLPAKIPQPTYRASLQIQVLQFRGLQEQELNTSFFVQFMINPVTLDQLRLKHPEVSLQQLTKDISASSITNSNLILLTAQATKAYQAEALVLDLYHILLEKPDQEQANLNKTIRAILQGDLRQVAGDSVAQSQRRQVVNKLLAKLQNPPDPFLRLNNVTPEVKDVTDHVPDRKLVLLLTAFVGTSFGIEICLRLSSRCVHQRVQPACKQLALLMLLVYSVFTLSCAWILTFSLTAGLACMLVLQVSSWLFTHMRFALPLYITLAGPSIGLGGNLGGILSRFFPGNLLFCILIILWILRKLLTGRSIAIAQSASRANIHRHIGYPLAGLIGCGLLSIVASRLFPDPQVAYAFLHSNVSLSLINLSEAGILIGLPLITVLVPQLIRSRYDVQLILVAYLGIGLVYAAGTIFASTLGLTSSETLLGHQRPVVFGTISSGLGNLLAIFACMAFSLFLYAPPKTSRAGYLGIFCILTIGVLFSLGREAWLALLFAISAIAGLYNRKWLLPILPILLFLLIVIISGSIDFYNPQKVYGSDRLAIWQDALTIWQRSPYLGVGAGNYQFFDLAYGSDIVGVAHNQFLEVLAEMGIQGLVCLIWFLIALGRALYQCFRAAVTEQGKAIALTAIGCYLIIIFGGFFTDTLLPSAAAGGGMGPFITTSYRWLLLGLALSIPGWEKR